MNNLRMKVSQQVAYSVASMRMQLTIEQKGCLDRRVSDSVKRRVSDLVWNEVWHRVRPIEVSVLNAVEGGKASV